MADQNITALPVATSPASSDQLLLVGATEEKLIDYDKLADAILTKLTSKQYTLDQGTKTLPAALNELNSNAFLPKAELRTNADSAEPGAYRVVGKYPVDGEDEAVLLCFKIFNNDWGLLTQFLIPKDSSYIKVRTCWYKIWGNWKKYNADS